VKRGELGVIGFVGEEVEKYCEERVKMGVKEGRGKIVRSYKIGGKEVSCV
jgi:hypothetical protein